MMKKLMTFLLWLALVFAWATPVSAKSLSGEEVKKLKLRVILKRYNSPLVGLEEVLINSAEQNGMDWTTLAAISGTESSFAKRMPYTCINPFGWGIYGKNKKCFKDLEASIQEVGKGIGEGYNTTSLYTIAKTYNPTHTNHRYNSTKFFANKIKNQPLKASMLPLDL